LHEIYIARKHIQTWRQSESLKLPLLKFHISLPVHLCIILVNNQFDALFSVYLFISLLYTFRATQCSSSEESNWEINKYIEKMCQVGY